MVRAGAAGGEKALEEGRIGSAVRLHQLDLRAGLEFQLPPPEPGGVATVGPGAAENAARDLAAEVVASTRANVLHLAASMLKDPGGRVPANLTPEVLGIAREAFRRGIEQSVYTTYHTGQNIVWGYWMRDHVLAVLGPGGVASGAGGRLPIGGRLRR
ncbi:MAG: hypothetical protein WAK82_19225 [Streptosporangiaceae bacterium]